MTNVKRPLKAFVATATRWPLLGGALNTAYRRYFNSVGGNARLFCGVFPDFASAELAVPAHRLVGYDNAPSAERMMAEWLGVYPSDYPVLFWLQKLLRDSFTVFDWGGNVGIKYFAFSSYLTYPENLRWVVNDVPAVLQLGREVAARESATALHFTAEMDELGQADILLASGVVQFIDDPFARLSSAASLPEHLIFNKVPLYDKPSRVTLHNMGVAFCPYHLFNRASFVASVEALGYELRDEWASPDISCNIPLSPQYSVAAYTGLYFLKSRSARP